MAKIGWASYNSARVGMSEWEQAELDKRIREAGGNPSRAGLSINEQEALGPDTSETSWSPKATPVHLAQYDRTGSGDGDSAKSAALASLLKKDPSGAAKIAAYTNQATAQSMIGHSFTQGVASDPFGGSTNMLAVAQDRYLNEMGIRAAHQTARRRRKR